MLGRKDAGDRYVLVGSVDGSGQLARFYPAAADGCAVALPAGDEPLGGSIVVDEAPGPERIVVLVSHQPLCWPVVGAALSRFALDGDGALPPEPLGANRHAARWCCPRRRARSVDARPLPLPVLALLPWLSVLSARFAIVATAAEATDQAPLRYVDADAERVRSVLEEVGSVDAGHLLRVSNATPETLRAALATAESALRGDPDGVLILYFSGHADEQGLLLGKQRFDYRELRQFLSRTTVKTRVVLLDACRTGGALASKGGHQAPPFDVRVLRPATVAGAAIIAASTASELAQESSRLEGSFFTHHLVSGLRGAADGNGDGRVTLAESYAYAYAQTLSSTSTTLLGPQHPSYQYELAGAGELVLTELGRAQATLSLPLRSAGDLFMVFDNRDNLVAEVVGSTGRPVSLALRVGTYRVARRRGGRAAVGSVLVVRRGQGRLRRGDPARATGGAGPGQGDPPPPPRDLPGRWAGVRANGRHSHGGGGGPLL